MRFDSSKLKRDFLHIGIKIQRIKLRGASRYSLVFPCTEGLHVLVAKGRLDDY